MTDSSDFMTAGMFLADMKKGQAFLDQMRNALGSYALIDDLERLAIQCQTVIRNQGPTSPDLRPLLRLMNNRLETLEKAIRQVADEFDLDLPK